MTTTDIYIYKWKNQRGCIDSLLFLSFAPKCSSDRTSFRLFDSFTYIYPALLPQHWALYAKVDSTPTFIYIYIYIFFETSFIFIHIFLGLEFIVIIWTRRKCKPNWVDKFRRTLIPSFREPYQLPWCKCHPFQGKKLTALGFLKMILND